MADLVVIVPSRGRPEVMAELDAAFADTCEAKTMLVVAVDREDPCSDKYKADDRLTRPVFVLSTRTMVEALNYTARAVATGPDAPLAIGFMGDDHRPRTKGWDTAYLDALRELGTGIVYGNDLLQGEALPTQCAMTSDIVRALGHMAPPGLTHLFVDDYWRDLGRSADCLRYLPDVVVEHMHPVAGKAEWSEGHRRVNAPAMYQADSDVYMDYRRTRFYADVAAVKALRGAR